MADTTLIDPLGRTVIFHDHTWLGHVLPGHPDMTAHRRWAEAAITDPLEIRISDADPTNCRLYFGRGPRGGIMVVAVANVTKRFVKTAFIVRRAKGAIEWSKPTP